jgi:hypothetical protein
VVQQALSGSSAPVLRTASASCQSGVQGMLPASHLAVLQLHRRGSLLLSHRQMCGPAAVVYSVCCDKFMAAVFGLVYKHVRAVTSGCEVSVAC